MRGGEVRPGTPDGDLSRREALMAGATGAPARAIPTATADTAMEKTRVTAAISWANATAPKRPRCRRGSVNPMYPNPAEDMAPSCSESACNGAKVGPKWIFDSLYIRQLFDIISQYYDIPLTKVKTGLITDVRTRAGFQ
jgi:hypothetical protein